jgi:hypothetical protein
MSRQHRRGHRSPFVRLVWFVWRSLRVILLAFCGLGPAPPPPEPPRRDPTEQRQEPARQVARRR